MRNQMININWIINITEQYLKLFNYAQACLI